MTRHRLAVAVENEETRGRGALVYAADEPLLLGLGVLRRVIGAGDIAAVLDVLNVLGGNFGGLGDFEGVHERLEEGL